MASITYSKHAPELRIEVRYRVSLYLSLFSGYLTGYMNRGLGLGLGLAAPQHVTARYPKQRNRNSETVKQWPTRHPLPVPGMVG